MSLVDQDTAASAASAIGEWKSLLEPCRQTLQKMAGTTEDEFLQLGSRLQDFYLRSSDITSMANQLVDTVSGERTLRVIDRLRGMVADMEAYLASARGQSSASCSSLEQILGLLDQVTRPLEGFQKLTKTLRMLGISTKIESSRLGETGLGFLTLALDVEKLAHLVSEKSSNILAHRQQLSQMINENLRIVRTNESRQDRELSGVLTNISSSLDELVTVNNRCTSFGSLVSSVSAEVSGNISEVVSSMQMHDMTRQQLEHIVEALERLEARLSEAGSAGGDSDAMHRLVIEAGDVCELQSAQLKFASSELTGAVTIIIDNLRDVAGKQAQMASESYSTTGSVDSSGGSFMDDISRGMATVTSVLAACAASDREMSQTLDRVAGTMQEVSGFVSDIEEIGSEIDLIALNSQIKAAHTGTEGAALGVLAEAIKRLSDDAITQTELVSETLVKVNQSTDHLFQDASEETEQLGQRITAMEAETAEIMAALIAMNSDLTHLLAELGDRVAQLTGDIESATSCIDVHERVREMTDEAMAGLEMVVAAARELEPASSEFKDNLRHMEARYTMDSERRIHEAIARKRGGQVVLTSSAPTQKAAEDTSEFGDNVDLF